jgi:hypothetical protein
MQNTIISRRQLMLPAVFVVLLAAVSTHAQVLLDARAITRRVLPAVVTIRTFDNSGRALGVGSGFVVSSNGLIVTNYHVIDKADAATVKFTNGEEARVEGVVDLDAEKDFAILKVTAIDLTVAALGNSEKLEQGEPLVAIGAPLGLSNTVSTGIVSEIRSLEGRRVIQHTASISPGSSGGPLINSAGQVVGINTFLLKDGQGLFFALPINYIRASLSSTDGKVVSLTQVHQFMQKEEEKQRSARIQKFLRDNFLPYQDPEQLFSFLAPRDWQVQRSEREDRDATRHVIVMFYPRNAEQAHINGWLSAGIRVHLRFPSPGHVWRVDSARTWQVNELDSTRRAATTRKTSDAKVEQIGNLNAIALAAVSETNIISKPELAWLYVSGTQQCLMSVEIVAPVDDEDDQKVVKAIFAESFKASWVR